MKKPTKPIDIFKHMVVKLAKYNIEQEMKKTLYQRLSDIVMNTTILDDEILHNDNDNEKYGITVSYEFKVKVGRLKKAYRKMLKSIEKKEKIK